MTEMRTIKLGDQDWKVTPFHCVVGQIVGPLPVGDLVWPAAEETHEHWWRLQRVWHEAFESAWTGLLWPSYCGFYTYPTEWQNWVKSWRQPDQYRPAGCWVLNYTNNPRIVNE